MRQTDRFATWIMILVLVAGCLAPVSPTAAASPGTKLYIGQAARFTAEIPEDWIVESGNKFDYVGNTGFVWGLPLSGATLSDVCASLLAAPAFEPTARLKQTWWQDQPACRIDGNLTGAGAASALVVPHPYPFDIYSSHVNFAALITDADHFDAISTTLDFSPDRVTPIAFYSSVLDILQARAYASENIDWDLTRQVTLASIEGLTELSMTRGTMQTLLNTLRLAGDNHSFVLFPDQGNALAESKGFGMLVGGSQILLVYPDGPAAHAGIQPGDIIETMNGHSLFPVTTMYHPESNWPLSVHLELRRPATGTRFTAEITQESYSVYVPPAGHRLPGDIGYIEIYGFSTPGNGHETEYAVAGNDLITAIDQPATCGWIVDLRLDTGGSYLPMVSAAGPILGNGTFVGWRDAGGGQKWVKNQNGSIIQDGMVISSYLDDSTLASLDHPNPPVAVLIGPNTSSSGEVTTLAFVGREDTRLFGEQTGGYTTANVVFFLFDGTQLVLADSAMTDRTGMTHLDGIDPDEPVDIDWATYGTAQDPVMNAASAWLQDQPACQADAAPVPTR